MALMDQISEFIFKTNFEDIPEETVSYTKGLTSKHQELIRRKNALTAVGKW
jgi:hypothetical protein